MYMYKLFRLSVNYFNANYLYLMYHLLAHWQNIEQNIEQKTTKNITKEFIL